MGNLSAAASEWLEARKLDPELAVKLGLESSQTPDGGEVQPISIDINGCWNWGGYIRRDGYGAVMVGKRPYPVHRLTYALAKGEPPEGLVLDHLCRNRRCCNPDHLDAVPIGENIRRGIGVTAERSRQTHCKNGHELAGDNLYLPPSGGRQCRLCRSENVKRLRTAKPNSAAEYMRLWRAKRRG